MTDTTDAQRVLREQYKKLGEAINKLDVVVARATPTMYASMDESTGEIYISAYPSGSPEWENNHMIIGELHGTQIRKHRSVLNVLSNIMHQVGVRVEIDPVEE